jgi:hypothetical protein
MLELIQLSGRSMCGYSIFLEFSRPCVGQAFSGRELSGRRASPAVHRCGVLLSAAPYSMKAVYRLMRVMMQTQGR